jgi:hypothetical protein
VSSLRLSSQPGFTEIPDPTFDAGLPVTSAAMKAMNANARFAAVRCEQFWGYYRNGETVILPVSEADGYAYSREELLYSWSLVSTCACPIALNGTHTFPGYGSTSGTGNALDVAAKVEQSTGLIETVVDYYKTSQQRTNDGVLMVITHAMRQR